VFRRRADQTRSCSIQYGYHWKLVGDGVQSKPLLGHHPSRVAQKLLLSVRYSQEVVAYFKSAGAGWQSRMDGVLREYVARRSSRPQRMGPNRARLGA
jgi:uncharacterized protein (DUF4415 family)